MSDPIPNSENSDSELTPEQIREQITKLTLALEAAERRKKLELATVTFSLPKIRDDRLTFLVDPIRSDVVEAVRDMGCAVVEGSVRCDPQYFVIALWEKLLSLPNVVFKFTEDEEKMIRTWKPAPHVYIKFDAHKQLVVFDLLSNAPTHPIYRSGVAYLSQGLNKYVLNVSSIYILREILDEYATPNYEKYRIFVDEDVLAALQNEESNRDKIAEVIKGDGSDLEPIILNGIRLRNFQTQGVEFLKHTNGNAIMAPEMGLGKTVISLAYIEWYWKNINATQKFLILVPASLRPNWSHEIVKYLGSDEKVYHLIGRNPASVDVQQLISSTNYRLFLMNYDSIAGSLKHTDPKTGILKSTYPWVGILSMASLKLVADEAHYIKNTSSGRSQAVLQTIFISSCMMTGTPMKNGPKELWPLVRKVKPNLAGTATNWETTYTTDNGRRARDPVRLRKVLEPIMFRRLKADVIKDLPPINRINVAFELSTLAKNAYNDILKGFYKQLKYWDGSAENSKAINNMLVEMMRMKQVCSEDKIDFVADRAVELHDSDESDYNKVIIFSQFANSPEIVKRIATKLGAEALYFTGNDDVYERQRIVDEFQNNPSIYFLVCSTKAAMEGLNITAAGHVIFVDLLWSPSDHSQAEGRAYGRMSNLHSITSSYIIAEGTIEDHIIGILMRKFEQIANTVDGKEIESSSIAMELFGKLRNLGLLS